MRARQLPLVRFPIAQWLLLAVALLLLGGAIGWNLYAEHAAIDARERERLTNQAEVVAKNIAPQLLLADHVIRSIIEKLPFWQTEEDGFKRANRELRVINDTLIGINPILVIGADGKVVASSNEALVGKNFAQREYFKSAIAERDQNILRISAPFKSLLDTFVISLYRTFTGPDGEFAGIVIVSAVPEYFYAILDSVRYAADVRTAIVHGAGTVFLNAPQRPGLVGRNVAQPGTFFTRHLEGGQPASLYTGRVSATGEERMIAHRTIRLAEPPTDSSLVVAVSRDPQAIFASWRESLYVQAMLFGLIAVFGVLALWINQRRGRDQHIERARADVALQDSKDQFRKVVENNPLSMAVVCMDGTIEYINRKAIETFGYQMQDIPNMDRWWVQAYPDEAYRAEVTAQWMGLVGDALARNHDIEQREYRVTCKNGDVKTVAIFGVWIADKVLVIFEDVTERKRLEDNLRRLNEELEQRVHERTAELTAAVEALQAEVQERLLAEKSALSLADRLKNMARRLGEAQELERRRLAAELHDGVCSNLAAIGLNLALLKNHLPQSDAAILRQRFSSLIDLIDEAKANAKDISVDLRPLLLEDRDLHSALEEYARKFEGSTGIPVAVRGTNWGRRLQAEEKIALFRIAQEALTNCAKHARAKSVAIELNGDSDHLALCIADDGVGIDLNRAEGMRQGLGLLSMQERADAIGGTWQIDSIPGKGTRVTVRVDARTLV